MNHPAIATGALRRFAITAALLPALALGLGAREARAISSTALLDTLQHSAFQFFWNEANPANGLVRDRSQPGSPASIASVGFGLSAICIGVDHGWVTREQGRDRVRTTLETFWNGPQSNLDGAYIGYKGLFYHFLDMNTATRAWSSELSTIDTALLLAGVLDAGLYFDGPDTNEVRIRWLADTLYRRVDWKFMKNLNSGILMGWKPGTGFSGFGAWRGYNEAMIMYILALGHPTATKTVPASDWTFWTGGYYWGAWYGYQYLVFAPLFGHQYSHCWIDFRHIQDAYMRGKGIDYFENSKRATLAQIEYCKFNQAGWTGYADSLWGLTACDGPSGYNARGAPPAQNDDGTIAPTAAAGSLPFTFAQSLKVLHNLWDHYTPGIWGPYGFRDALNPTYNWYDPDYIGIDEGPIVLMIENYRTGAVWNRFMTHPYIQAGLAKAGFLPSTTAGVEGPRPGAAPIALAAEPNPFRDETLVRFTLPAGGPVRAEVLDVGGRRVRELLDRALPAGEHTVTFGAAGLPAGVYLVRVEAGGQVSWSKVIRVR